VPADWLAQYAGADKMMAVTALSLPEFMILKRVMKTKLIIIFASVVGLGIIFTGYLFNWVI